MRESVYLVNGARTPIGSLNGVLSSLTAPELGAVALRGALERAGVDADQPSDVYMGCVLTAGVGQAPARQALIKAGLPYSVGATTIGKVCGSGMKSVMLARAEILAGESACVLAGGMESMSHAPYMIEGARIGLRLGHQKLYDSLISDGLWDPYNDLHMGNCAESCIAAYHFTRQDQDDYAIASYQRALNAIETGAFKDEIAPVPVPQRKGDPVLVADDEEPHKVQVDKIPTLKPAFGKEGTITAANASSINDGAAALVLASESYVKQQQLTPMARILSVATHSQDPLWFSTAPVEAIRKALKKADLTVDDIDIYEVNEAFAAVPMAVMKDLAIPHDKMNMRGSGVSLGHPIGASGARILVTLLYLLQHHNKQYGLASLCIGGGEATAMVIERVG